MIFIEVCVCRTNPSEKQRSGRKKQEYFRTLLSRKTVPDFKLRRGESDCVIDLPILVELDLNLSRNERKKMFVAALLLFHLVTDLKYVYQ